MQNYGPGTSWYKEHVTQVRGLWHPVDATERVTPEGVPSGSRDARERRTPDGVPSGRPTREEPPPLTIGTSKRTCNAGTGRSRSCPVKVRMMHKHKHDDAQCMRFRCTSAFLPKEGEGNTRARCRTMHAMQLAERVPAQ